MVGENGDDVAAAAKHILRKSLQRFLRSHLHKHARAGVIQGAQTLNELHRGSNLLRQNIQHLRHDVRPAGIELTIDVRDDWQAGRLEMQPLEHAAQRLARRRNDGSVESVADRQRGYFVAGFLESFHCLFHSFAGPADDGLVLAVDIRDDHVSIYGL